MLTLQLKTTRLTVTEANAAKYRTIVDSGKLPRIKMPNSTPIRRGYPAFMPGMTTADYVAAFNRQFDGVQIRVQHDCPRYHMAAPMLDATQPEVLEELDPYYVEQPVAVKASKARRPGAPELRLALSCILDVEPDPEASVHDLWLALGEIRKIAKHMLEG